MSETDYPLYEFPDCQSIVISGDIHGDFNLLVNKVCAQYKMHDTLVIVAGDCGFGFEKIGSYENMLRRNSRRMNAANNWILFMRGNHDNPAYFDGHTFNHKRFLAIPDYSVIKANGHTILCVGGAISLDRQYRMNAWKYELEEIRKYGRSVATSDRLTPNYYWSDEAPTFDDALLTKIATEQQIDTIVTHTAPSFCELSSKDGLAEWTIHDENLLNDVQHERMVMDSIYNKMKAAKQPLSHWYYGHFHQSWHSSIDGVLFRMLDIIELAEVASDR